MFIKVLIIIGTVLYCSAIMCQEIDSLKSLATKKMVELYSNTRNKPQIEKQWQKGLPDNVFAEILHDAQVQNSNWLGAQRKKVPIYQAGKAYPQYHSQVCYFSPDDALMAVPLRYGSIKLYSTDTAHIVSELQGHSKYLGDMCFADNRTLISAAGKTIKLWDVLNKKEITSFTTDASVARLFSSSDSTELYCLLSTGVFQTWDLKDADCKDSMQIPFAPRVYEHEDIRERIKFKKNKQLMLFECDYSTLRILDLKEGTYKDIKRGLEVITNYSLLPYHVMYFGNNDLIALYNIVTAQTDNVLNCSESHTKKILKVKVFKSWLITSSLDCTIKIWDSKCGKCLNTLKGHTAPVGAMKVNKKQKLLYAGDKHGYIKVWDMARGNCLHTIDTNDIDKRSVISKLTFLDNAHLLCDTTNYTSIWNIAHLHRSYCAFIQKNSYDKAIISPSGTSVVIPTNKNHVYLVRKPDNSQNIVTRCPSVLLLFPVTIAVGVSLLFIYCLA